MKPSILFKRRCVYHFISKWRKNNIKNDSVCVKCKSPKNLTADHITPVSVLKRDFCAKNNIKLNKLMNDRSFWVAFKAYHKQHAALQILCFDCNQQKDDDLEEAHEIN